MLGAFHLWDLVPVAIVVGVGAAAFAVMRRSIGAGYVWMQRRLERRQEQS